MTALANIWKAVTNVSRIDDDTTRLTLTDIGVDLDGTKFQITGVGCTDGDLFEDLLFDAVRVTDDTVDIDWDSLGYTAPPDDWTTSGMVRLYEAPLGLKGALRFSYGHNIASLTSTGNTGEFDKDNVLNSNRASTHTFTTGDQQMVVTMIDTSLVETVALLDLVCDLDATIRIRGAGTLEDVDVIYPAISPRFRPNERPKLGYKRINPDGHNLDDLVPHFIAYPPPMMPASVTINILNSSSTVEFSELILCSYYTPDRGLNATFGAKLQSNIVATTVQRGKVAYRDYEGVQSSSVFNLSFMGAYDRTNVNLIAKSKRTMIADLYPLEYSIRWEALVAGYSSKAVSVIHEQGGSSVDISIISTKLHEGL